MVWLYCLCCSSDCSEQRSKHQTHNKQTLTNIASKTQTHHEGIVVCCVIFVVVCCVIFVVLCLLLLFLVVQVVDCCVLCLVYLLFVVWLFVVSCHVFAGCLLLFACVGCC